MCQIIKFPFILKVLFKFRFYLININNILLNYIYLIKIKIFKFSINIIENI